MEKQMLLTIGVSFVLTLVIGRFVLTELRKLIDEKNPGCELEVDGGVDPETCKTCIAAGANVLVAGSAVYKAEDIPARIAALRG